MKSDRLSLCCALVLIALSAPVWAATLSGRVVLVADGDTLTVLDAVNVQHKVRLAGIDAPERAQPFGRRAKDLLAGFVAGRDVSVETGKVDRYGRTIGKVLVQGRDVNLAMVVAGMAWHYKAYEREQAPADRLLYSSAEVEARAARKGLWRDVDPVAPWSWRAAKRESNRIRVN